MAAAPGQWSGHLLAGRYRVGSKLGRGAIGTVYEATQLDLNRRVAIKVMHGHLASGAHLARFRREAEAVAALGHPNIVQVTDFQHNQEAGEPPFMVLEYLEGRTLEQLLRKEGKLTPQRVVFIMQQLLSALEAAHAAGIIHRDLKPGNIFLTTVSEIEDIVKVLDFGVAKVLSGSELTEGGETVGTPSYMAPEQALGTAVDGRTDLFTIGVVMFRALSGRLPFQAAHAGAVLRAVLEDEPPDLEELCPDIESALAHVVQCALTKDPDNRFASATEMREALAPWAPLTPRDIVGVPTETDTLDAEPPTPGTQSLRVGAGLPLRAARPRATPTVPPESGERLTPEQRKKQLANADGPVGLQTGEVIVPAWEEASTRRVVQGVLPAEPAEDEDDEGGPATAVDAGAEVRAAADAAATLTAPGALPDDGDLDSGRVDDELPTNELLQQAPTTLAGAQQPLRPGPGVDRPTGEPLAAGSPHASPMPAPSAEATAHPDDFDDQETSVDPRSFDNQETAVDPRAFDHKQTTVDKRARTHRAPGTAPSEPHPGTTGHPGDAAARRNDPAAPPVLQSVGGGPAEDPPDMGPAVELPEDSEIDWQQPGRGRSALAFGAAVLIVGAGALAAWAFGGDDLLPGFDSSGAGPANDQPVGSSASSPDRAGTGHDAAPSLALPSRDAASSDEVMTDAARTDERSGRPRAADAGTDGGAGGRAEGPSTGDFELTTSSQVELPRVPDDIARLPESRRQAIARRARNRAHGLMRRRLYRAAEKGYRKALQYAPESAATARGLARALARRDELDEGMAWASHAVQLQPEAVSGYVVLGDLLRDAGRDDEARDAWQQALALAPDNSSVRRRLDRLEKETR